MNRDQTYTSSHFGLRTNMSTYQVEVVSENKKGSALRALFLFQCADVNSGVKS